MGGGYLEFEVGLFSRGAPGERELRLAAPRFHHMQPRRASRAYAPLVVGCQQVQHADRQTVQTSTHARKAPRPLRMRA
jgi:hypothetical protein